MNYVSFNTKLFKIGSKEYETNFYKKLFHYTKKDVVDKINESCQLRATSIAKYKDDYKEKIQYEEEQEYLIFCISFSHKLYSNSKRAKFKSSNGLISINFIDNMYEVFDYSRPIITNTGDKLMWCNKGYGDYYLDNDLVKSIEVDVKCIDPKYCTDDELNKCKGEKTRIINYRPKLRKNEKWQTETRYEFHIRTTSRDNIFKYKYLEVPIKIDMIEFFKFNL